MENDILNEIETVTEQLLAAKNSGKSVSVFESRIAELQSRLVQLRKQRKREEMYGEMER